MFTCGFKKAEASDNTVFLLRRIRSLVFPRIFEEVKSGRHPCEAKWQSHPVAFAPLSFSGSGTQQRYVPPKDS